MVSQSIWENESFYAPQDIIIVGGGLMGLWSALELKKSAPSLRICIVERNEIPTGASTRNAGFACFGSPTELLHDAAVLGKEEMLKIVEMRYKGIQKIRAHFQDSVIDYDACGGYECINKDYSGWDSLEHDLKGLNDLLKEVEGSPSLFKIVTEKIPSLGLRGFDCLVENKSEAGIHSGKLVMALTEKVRSEGIVIMNGFDVTRLEQTADQVTLYSVNKTKLTCKRVLVCTNAFTSELIPSPMVQPARGQVIVSSPIPNLPLKGTFHFDQGYYYWRNLGNRILLGGARNSAFEAENTSSMKGSDFIREELESFLKAHIDPSIAYTIEHHWSGIMGFTHDKKPFVGQVDQNIYAAIACNGMGVALTPLIAEHVATEILSNF